MTTRQTPDAVRVTQADRDAAADGCGSVSKAKVIRRGEMDHTVLVQAFAAHRLAVFDSRASDAVKWRERWHGSEPEKGSAIVDYHGNLIAYLGGDEATHAAVTRIVSAHNATLSTLPTDAIGQSEEPLVRFVQMIADMVGDELDANCSVELRDAARSVPASAIDAGPQS